MNTQEIYNTVRDHLLKQGARSADGYGRGCEYRSAYGRMYAVGCLIPDALYSTELEGYWVDQDPVVRVLMDAGVLDGVSESSDRRITLLNRLQMVHDDYDPATWADLLRSTAYEFGLQP